MTVPRTRRRALVGLAVILAVAGIALTGIGVAAQRLAAGDIPAHSTPTPAAPNIAPPAKPTDTAPPAAGLPAQPITAAANPALQIPALGVDVPITPIAAAATAAGAVLTPPTDIHTVGWWDGQIVAPDGTVTADPAPAPGQPGVAVIAGHIDSYTGGPGALYRLGRLHQGDHITVTAAGVTTHWTVDSPPQQIAKNRLPAEIGTHNGPPRLAVITCGGPFDPATGHYADNIIVWATPA